eukprot:1675647-Amphidinium_carterae.2
MQRSNLLESARFSLHIWQNPHCFNRPFTSVVAASLGGGVSWISAQDSDVEKDGVDAVERGHGVALLPSTVAVDFAQDLPGQGVNTIGFLWGVLLISQRKPSNACLRGDVDVCKAIPLQFKPCVQVAQK